MIAITEHPRYILAPSHAEVSIGSIVNGFDIQRMVRGSTEVLNYVATQILFKDIRISTAGSYYHLTTTDSFCFLLPNKYSCETFDSHGSEC